MKGEKHACILMAVLILALFGCSDRNEEKTGKKIEVEKYVNQENRYEEYKDVTSDKEVEKAQDILEKAYWTKAKMEMAHPPDYQFVFLSKNPEIAAFNHNVYKVWISPNQVQLEIIQGTNEYAQLPKKQSALLFKVLTGNTLYGAQN